MSKDPISFAGGDTNLYRYVNNQSASYTDASGRSATLIGAAVGFVGGFVAGGLTGEGTWSWDRALAGGASGALVGAGVGLMVDTFGFGAPGSAVMISAGIGSGALTGAGLAAASGGNLFKPGQDVDWNGYNRGLVVGAASGAASGLVGGGLGGALAARGFSVFATQVISGVASGLAGNAVGQVVGIAAGSPQGFRADQLLLAGITGGLSGATAGLFTRGVVHQAGENAGQIICGTTLTSWMTRNIAGSMTGALVGDALTQGYGYLTAADRSQWSWDFGQTISSVAMAGATSAITARMMWANMQRACFTGDVLARARGDWGEGWRRFDLLNVGDEVLSRDEYDINGPLEWKRVEEKFVRTGRIWHLHLEGDKLLRTTGEHPFFAFGKGWIAASELVAGDLLNRDDGQWVAVAEVYDTGEYETVYNLRVADFHTYFVGSETWGFSVWAHNRACEIEVLGGEYVLRDTKTRTVIQKGTQLEIDQLVAAKGYKITKMHASQDRVLTVVPSSKMDLLIEGAKPSQAGKLVKVDAYTNQGDHAPPGSKVRDASATRPYDPTKSVLPDNHVELFQQSVPIARGDGKIVRWTAEMVDGSIVYHRFEQQLPNVYHWNGASNGVRDNGVPRPLLPNQIPSAEIKAAFGL